MLTYNWIINIFCIIILIIIEIAYARYGKSANSSYAIFTAILYIAMAFLFFDAISRYDGLDNPLWRVYNEVGNFMLFLLSPILPSLWLAIVYNKVFNREFISRKFIFSIFAINLIHLVLLIGTQFSGWLYDISELNVYARGPLYLISPIITFILLLIGFLLPILHRKKLSKNLLFPFLFFPIPALAGVLLQSLIYGIDFSLKGVVISILFYFIFVLSHQTTIDYLTGVYNRKGLDDYLKKLARNATKTATFTAIMIDIDDFKRINDEYGHDQGDEALKTTVDIVHDCLTPSTFVARYGGDEFFIVIETGEKKQIDKVVESLNYCFTKFNNSKQKPYQLTYSIGVSTYDPETDRNVESFRRRVDRLMYEDKNVVSHLYHSD